MECLSPPFYWDGRESLHEIVSEAAFVAPVFDFHSFLPGRFPSWQRSDRVLLSFSVIMSLYDDKGLTFI